MRSEIVEKAVKRLRETWLGTCHKIILQIQNPLDHKFRIDDLPSLNAGTKSVKLISRATRLVIIQTLERFERHLKILYLSLERIAIKLIDVLQRVVTGRKIQNVRCFEIGNIFVKIWFDGKRKIEVEWILKCFPFDWRWNSEMSWRRVIIMSFESTQVSRTNLITKQNFSF